MARSGATTPLQAARKAHGMTQAQVIRAMLRRADELNLGIAVPTSLATMLSRWENAHDQVTEAVYRRLLREILGRTNTELGFPDEPEDEGTDELRARIGGARAVDRETAELLQREIDTIRHLDRRFGAATLLDQLMTHVEQIAQLLAFSPESAQRALLASTLADAAALAGWEALDRGALARAWHLHETAKSAAREAGSTSRLAYAVGQQSFVLLALGDTDAANRQLDHARSLGATAPPLLRTWLAAAHGEALAALGERDGALSAFDAAGNALPAETEHPDLPFLMLNDGHLDRWRGHALTHLGEREAVDLLERTLRELSTNTARGRVGTLTDLAFAHSIAGDRDAALAYSRQARQLAAQIGSDRQRKRLLGLVLPVPRRAGA